VKTCCIKDCHKPVLAKGLCSGHYQRVRKYGDPTFVLKPQLHGYTVKERLDLYTAQSPEGCWEWRASKDARGYGRLNVGNVPQLAHRLSWQFRVGPIPDGAQVLHRCDNPGCVRPDHLFLGDHAANMADMNGKGRGRPGLVQGEAHGCAKLTDEQVREIRASEGPSHIIAERYGISGRQVRAIRNREAWQHVE
jgi:hypothetical protein